MPDINDLWYRYRWQFLLGLLGVCLFLFGLISLRLGELFSSDEFEVVNSFEGEGEIVVEVAGAVVSPGVYKMESDSRVEDVLVAAGGFSDQVDMGYVERAVNRASVLADGQKIYIPFLGEDVQGEAAVSGIVNINSADKAELESLWGIGPVTAQNIIENRPYSDVSELVEKKILKSNVYERNFESFSVY